MIRDPDPNVDMSNGKNVEEWLTQQITDDPAWETQKPPLPDAGP